jgi:cysteinyl-tRNA synthetase
MYVCGPTVYDYPHIGNARSVVVYDLLFRLLQRVYGVESINYVRNITDVDDKINIAAKARQITINKLTQEIIEIFTQDMYSLGCLAPTVEPRATEHIEEMIFIIKKLIDKNHAYIANNHVYFSIKSDPSYGKLAGREIEEMIPGSRINIEKNKLHPGDFVLWKPQDAEDDVSSVFDSPWGKGRPGWHIECSAMSYKYLGSDFDIHGGGADLMFPHHTNEMAQSCCAFEDSKYANYWVHNGFLTVNGEKMSKSLGNFTTVRQLLDNNIRGEAIRLVLLLTHYRKPLDFNDKALSDAKKTLDGFYRIVLENPAIVPQQGQADDLNTPAAITTLHEISKAYNKENDVFKKTNYAQKLKASCNLLGLLSNTPQQWFSNEDLDINISNLINERNIAKNNKNWAVADQIRNQLKNYNIILEDKIDGTTTWRKL